jgi:hypothetical protein
LKENMASPSSRKEENEVLHVGFNQDTSCLAVGTTRGFRVYNSDPFKEFVRLLFPFHLDMNPSFVNLGGARCVLKKLQKFSGICVGVCATKFSRDTAGYISCISLLVRVPCREPGNIPGGKLLSASCSGAC